MTSAHHHYNQHPPASVSLLDRRAPGQLSTATSSSSAVLLAVCQIARTPSPPHHLTVRTVHSFIYLFISLRTGEQATLHHHHHRRHVRLFEVVKRNQRTVIAQ